MIDFSTANLNSNSRPGLSVSGESHPSTADKWHSNVPAVERQRILVVEDEAEIRELIALHLRREGHEVETVGSAEEAKARLGDISTLGKSAPFPVSILVLDWMLPGLSGVELAKNLRSNPEMSDIAILMVTARAESSDIVAGLEAGADDYLTKPFEPSVLLARVRALIRRSRRGAPLESEGGVRVLRVGELAIYPDTFEAKCSEELVQLTPSEFKLLLTLVQNRGRVLTRDSLIEHVQGEGVSVVGRTVDTHVFGLRKKLGNCADVIETVRGVGYRVKPMGES